MRVGLTDRPTDRNSLQAGNWRIVLTMLQQLRVVNEQPQAGKASTAYDIEILSRIGKVFLQMGSGNPPEL